MARLGSSPDLTVRQLKTIVAVARFENFLAAAVELRTSQSGVSRTIKQAERLLGEALFDRTTRRVSLSPAGRNFVPVAERILAELEDGVAKLDAEREQAERLYVSSLTSLAYDILPLAISAFWRAEPGVELILRQRLQAHILEDVRKGAVDFGLANRANVDEQFGMLPVGRDRYYVMSPKGHRLAQAKSASIHDLAGERLVSFAHAANVRRLVDGMAQAAGVELEHGVTLDQITLADRFVRRGIGVAVVTETMMNSDDPAVAFTPFAEGEAETEIVAYFARDRGLSPLARRFIDQVAAAFQAGRSGPLPGQ